MWCDAQMRIKQFTSNNNNPILLYFLFLMHKISLIKPEYALPYFHRWGLNLKKNFNLISCMRQRHLCCNSSNLPFSTLGTSGASWGRLLDDGLESCCNCPVGCASFSASRGFAAAIVNLSERISTVTCALFCWLVELCAGCSLFEFGILLLFSSCWKVK